MNTKSNKAPKTQPAHQIRSRSVKAALWKNETEKGTFFNITLERLYKDGEVWKSASSFGLGDTSDIEAVLKQAREWVQAQQPVAAPVAASSHGPGSKGSGSFLVSGGSPTSLKHSHFEFPLKDSASKVRGLSLPLPSRQGELSVIALLLQPLPSSLLPNRFEASASLHPRHILIATSQLASRSE